MKNKRIQNGGYVGLLMLLIGVAIMAFLMVRSDLFSGQKNDKGMLENGIDAVDQAKAAKDLIESRSRQAVEDGL